MITQQSRTSEAYKPTQVTPWLQLNRLLETNHSTILGREKNNHNHIHLYAYGTYWAAFEQSAYQLCRLFPGSSTAIILQIKGHPFPAIMATLPDKELYTPKAVQYPTRTVTLDYKILAVPNLTPTRYRAGYTRLLKQYTEIQHLINQ